MKSILLFALLGLCGCAGSPVHLTGMSSAELQDSEHASTERLVNALWHQRAMSAKATLDPEICDELVRRGALTAAEVARASSMEPTIGDHIWVPYIGWGQYMKHNVYASGTQHQYVINVGGKQFIFYTGPDRHITSFQAFDR